MHVGIRSGEGEDHWDESGGRTFEQQMGRSSFASSTPFLNELSRDREFFVLPQAQQCPRPSQSFTGSVSCATVFPGRIISRNRPGE